MSVINKDNKKPHSMLVLPPNQHLLYVDLKMLTSIVANTIQKEINQPIKPDQTDLY